MVLIHILFIFLTVAVYTLAGRMVFTHVNLKRDGATPLACFAIGSGIWFLWFLALQGALGVSLSVTWYTFLLSVFALSFVLTRILPHESEHTLFWPKVAVGVVLTFPAFVWLTKDQPLLWAELTHFLKNSADFLFLNAIPTAEVAQKFDIFSPFTATASQVLVLPAMLMADAFLPMALPLLNVVVFILIAAELVRCSRFEVTAQNLAGVTGLSLFALVVLNPFFMPTVVFSAYPDVLIAASILAVCVPLMRTHQHPKGLGAFTYGFILLFLGGALPSGWLLVVLLLACFFIFGHGWHALRSVEGVGGLILLWGLPFIAFCLEAFSRGVRGYSTWDSHLFEKFNAERWFEGVGQAFWFLKAQPFILLTLCLLVGWFILNTIQKKRDLYVTLPLFLVMVYGFGIGGVYAAFYGQEPVPFAQGILHHILHLQFVILLPFWRLAYAGLQRFFDVWSGATGETGKHFSVVSSIAFGLFWLATVGVNASYIAGNKHAPLQHTLQVADAMRADKDYVLWADRVAVLDGTATRGYYVRALSYGLRHHAKVRSVFQEFADAGRRFDVFHDALLEKKFDYVWLHAPTPEISIVLGGHLRPEASYLFKVTPQGLSPVRVYNHAGYTYQEAAKVPLF